MRPALSYLGPGGFTKVPAHYRTISAWEYATLGLTQVSHPAKVSPLQIRKFVFFEL